jgi:hypothetical protein
MNRRVKLDHEKCTIPMIGADFIGWATLVTDAMMEAIERRQKEGAWVNPYSDPPNPRRR